MVKTRKRTGKHLERISANVGLEAEALGLIEVSVNGNGRRAVLEHFPPIRLALPMYSGGVELVPEELQGQGYGVVTGLSLILVALVSQLMGWTWLTVIALAVLLYRTWT